MSKGLSRLKHAELNAKNECFKCSSHAKDYKFFGVAGAGEIAVSKSAKSYCGFVKEGFSVSVSWSDSGLNAGGVMSREEALKLANHIIKTCK